MTCSQATERARLAQARAALVAGEELAQVGQLGQFALAQSLLGELGFGQRQHGCRRGGRIAMELGCPSYHTGGQVGGREGLSGVAGGRGESGLRVDARSGNRRQQLHYESERRRHAVARVANQISRRQVDQSIRCHQAGAAFRFLLVGGERVHVHADSSSCSGQGAESIRAERASITNVDVTTSNPSASCWQVIDLVGERYVRIDGRVAAAETGNRLTKSNRRQSDGRESECDTTQVHKVGKPPQQT